MAGPALEYVYTYPFPSTVTSHVGESRVLLATSPAPRAPSLFFRGRLRQPRRTADLLLALVRVVQARFHVPAAMLARIIALADPVVTCAEDCLRFEGFSGCCSAYARVDLLPEAVEGALLASGTTNVDFNPGMRAALARLGDEERVGLTVGAGEVELEAAGGSVVERKVPLPVRWLKGFVEAQAYQARMAPRLEVSGAEALRFLRGLPRQGTQGRPAWVVPSGKGLRLSQVEGRGLCIRVAGLERLRVLEEVARHARSLRVWSEEGGASGWELAGPDARFFLVLSPEVWRGFSGEGQLLADLALEAGEPAVEVVRARLGAPGLLPPELLARRCGLSQASVRAALARLAGRGLVGFDLHAGTYFHRELPFDLSLVEALQPRLVAARRLVAAGGVRVEQRGPAGGEAWVRGTDVEHRVQLDAEGGARCTCPWYARHHGERGPCKHVLAVQIALESADDA